MKYKFIDESELNRFEKDHHSASIRRGLKHAKGKGKAIIYCRVATSAIANNRMSIETQRELCMQWIAKHGYKLVGSYADMGSGLRIQGRKALQDLLIQSRRKGSGIKVIVATDEERISRSVWDYCLINEQLQKAGIKLMFTNRDKETMDN